MSRIAAWWAHCRTMIDPRAARGERGNSAVEYAMLLALVVVVCIVAVTFIGESTGQSLSETASMIP